MSKVKIQGNASGTGVVTLTAPNTNTDRTITLPDSTGSILDSTSTLDATKLSGNLPAIDGSALTGMPAGGKVLQVVQTLKTNGSSFSSNSVWLDMPGLSLTITPSLTSSKVLISFSVAISRDGANAYPKINLLRNGVSILRGDVDGTRTRSSSSSGFASSNNNTVNTVVVEYLDSPSTSSSVTYKLQTFGYASRVFYVNSMGGNDAQGGSLVSTITAMEIGA